jgi:hypothetical protein
MASLTVRFTGTFARLATSAYGTSLSDRTATPAPILPRFLALRVLITRTIGRSEFAGHGSNGHRVATFVSDRLGKELLALTGAPSSRQGAAAAAAALREAHHRTARALEASAVDCTAAGCTGVCILLLRHSPGRGLAGENVAGGIARQDTASRPGTAAVAMLVSNVGDSRAVLGSSVPRRGQFGTAQFDSGGLAPPKNRTLAKSTHSPSTVSARPAHVKGLAL